jgi:hypothetical protein
MSRAECDARKLPEASYRLVMLLGDMGPSHIGAARRLLDLGLQADLHALSSLKTTSHLRFADKPWRWLKSTIPAAI